jgi:pimeloyl-ACP methyl ester carboxylesterase
MDFDYVVVPAALLVGAIGVLWFSIRYLRTLASRPRLKVARVLDLTILIVANVVILGVGINASVNAVLTESFRVRHPEPGTDYLVNGKRMHLNCTGAGSPTIVLDSGLGWDSVEWGGVQPTLAKGTRVCSYDRPGFGLSEAGVGPRDAVHIAGELHGLLCAAGVSGPIVLMGHSIAGMYIREYATQYPVQVAGLVFVDSSTPLQNRDARLNTGQGAGLPLWESILEMRAAAIVGYPRLKGECAGPDLGVGAEADAWLDHAAASMLGEDLCHVHYKAVQAEYDSFDASGQETLHTGPFGDLPVLVISQDTAKQFAGHNPTARELEFASTWDGMQESLKNLSTRGRRIVAKGSGHNITLERPDVIEREVSQFIETIRGNGVVGPPTHRDRTATYWAPRLVAVTPLAD